MARLKRPNSGSSLMFDAFGNPMPLLPWGRNISSTMTLASGTATASPFEETGVVVVYSPIALRCQIGPDALNLYPIPAETLVPIPLPEDLTNNALQFTPYNAADLTEDIIIDVRETLLSG